MGATTGGITYKVNRGLAFSVAFGNLLIRADQSMIK